MAIGSAPEIGTEFTTWGQMTEESRLRWWAHIRNNWGPALVNGYGTLVYADEAESLSRLVDLSDPDVIDVLDGPDSQIERGTDD